MTITLHQTELLPDQPERRWTKARLPRWEGGNPRDSAPGANSAEWTKADMERNLRAPTWREHFRTHEDT